MKLLWSVTYLNIIKASVIYNGTMYSFVKSFIKFLYQMKFTGTYSNKKFLKKNLILEMI